MGKRNLILRRAPGLASLPRDLLLIVCYYMCARLGFSFQDSYCRVLVRYKEELSRPFDEAASFLSSVRTQLSTLCGGAASLSGSPPAARLHLPSLPPPAGGQGSKYELPSPLRTWHASVQCIVGGRG